MGERADQDRAREAAWRDEYFEWKATAPSDVPWAMIFHAGYDAAARARADEIAGLNTIYLATLDHAAELLGRAEAAEAALAEQAGVLARVREAALDLGACEKCDHTNPECQIVQLIDGLGAVPDGQGGRG